MESRPVPGSRVGRNWNWGGLTEGLGATSIDGSSAWALLESPAFKESLSLEIRREKVEEQRNQRETEQQFRTGSSWLKQELEQLLTNDWTHLVGNLEQKQPIMRTVSANLLRSSLESAEKDRLNWSNRECFSPEKKSDLFQKHEQSLQKHFKSVGQDIFKKHQNILEKKKQLQKKEEEKFKKRGNQEKVVESKKSNAKDILEKYNKKINRIFSGKQLTRKTRDAKETEKEPEKEFPNEAAKEKNTFSGAGKVDSIMKKYQKRQVSREKRETGKAQKRIPSKFRAKAKETPKEEKKVGAMESENWKQEKEKLMSYDKVSFKEEVSQFLSLSPVKQPTNFLKKTRKNKRNVSNLKKFKRGKAKDGNSSFVETLKKKIEPKKILDNSDQKSKLYKIKRRNQQSRKSDLKKKLLNRKFLRKNSSETGAQTPDKFSKRTSNKRNISVGFPPRLEKIKRTLFHKKVRNKSVLDQVPKTGDMPKMRPS